MYRKIVGFAFLTLCFPLFANAEALLDESFDYPLPDGGDLVPERRELGPYGGWSYGWGNPKPLIFSGQSLDTVGGAGSFVASNAAAYRPLTIKNLGMSSTTFSFLLDLRKLYATELVEGSVQGSRVMFETTGPYSDEGYGVNFDYEYGINEVNFYLRTGGVNHPDSAFGIAYQPDLILQVNGSYRRNGAEATLTMTYMNAVTGEVFGSQEATAPLPEVMGDYMMVRSKGNIEIDRIILEVQSAEIPEPATYAALLGLGILAWVAYRRRGREVEA